MTTDAEKILNYGRHEIDAVDIDAVVRVLESDFITSGPVTEKFEFELGQYLNNQNVVVCSNGTSALYIASKVLEVGQNDVVIVPSQTFLATASVPHLLGAEVIFCDVDPKTGLMNSILLEDAILRAKREFPTKKLSAIYVVHLNGQSVQMPSVYEVARKHDAFLIEDACHGLGGNVSFVSDSEPKKIGNCQYSDAATFSFHPVKNMTTGEGGAVAFSEVIHTEKAKICRSHGVRHDDLTLVDSSLAPIGSWSHVMIEPSLNFRLPDILCALGISQLRKLDKWKAKRRELVEYYRTELSNLTQAELVQEVPWCDTAWHLMPLLINYEKLEINRVALFSELNAQGIYPQVHYQPVHLQPYWRSRNLNCSLPGAEEYYHRVFSLPLFVDMTEQDVVRVRTSLASALK